MKREDFKVVPKFYTTTNLVYIILNGVVIDYVETFKDLFFVQLDKDNWESQKKKRKPQEITDECESKISKYIKANS